MIPSGGKRPFILFQSSTRQTDFATAGAHGGVEGFVLVSILYEADRLCNLGEGDDPASAPQRFNPLRGRQTLQQPVRALLREAMETVSILYEADRLCNSASAIAPWPRPARSFNPLRGRQTLQPPGALAVYLGGDRFQSSTRQTDFATAVLYLRVLVHVQVSILYEADRLCNRYRGGLRCRNGYAFQSSTRQTDFATKGQLR